MILRAWYPTRAKCLKPLRFLSIGDIFQWESQQQLPASIGLTGFITRLNFHCQTIGRRFGSKFEGDSGFIGQQDQLFHPSQRGELACICYAAKREDELSVGKPEARHT